jgi:hypothetical protein
VFICAGFLARYFEAYKLKVKSEILKFFVGKFFGKFRFGHFFCPFSKKENTFAQKPGRETIIEFYRLVTKKITQNLLPYFFLFLQKRI